MKTFNTLANAAHAAPATQHFTFFDIETHWDEVLHDNYCFIQHSESWPPRIGTRRIHAAAAFDLALAGDGAITCERIASWTMSHDGGGYQTSQGSSCRLPAPASSLTPVTAIDPCVSAAFLWTTLWVTRVFCARWLRAGAGRMIVIWSVHFRVPQQGTLDI
ncbi:hypothetical protein [Novosphingobium cyanobacteriorum]|uniref:Uncharacterized protein n=1 Tax=Novosphingobium cyanobacteriorum TaxID=3024215 RepID=A0ABT6CPJ1_9SPHN|nr:hypothetical protein [Novosphingobium cyanobacteriorum]MDF8335845.1 hypothetical protein [Novosphingobium cyanobacteriorum]